MLIEKIPDNPSISYIALLLFLLGLFLVLSGFGIVKTDKVIVHHGFKTWFFGLVIMGAGGFLGAHELKLIDAKEIFSKEKATSMASPAEEIQTEEITDNNLHVTPTKQPTANKVPSIEKTKNLYPINPKISKGYNIASDIYHQSTNLNEYISRLGESGKNGNSGAYSYLGGLYNSLQSSGKFSVIKNDKKAVFWYEKSSKLGNPHAKRTLAIYYELGLGVPKNAQKSFEYYLASAKLGDNDSKFSLAEKFCYGYGTRKNLKECKYWLNQCEVDNKCFHQKKIDSLIEKFNLKNL